MKNQNLSKELSQKMIGLAVGISPRLAEELEKEIILFAKTVHKNARHQAVEIVNKFLAENEIDEGEKTVTGEIMNLRYQDAVE